jgi:hypothetical protein
MKQLLLCGLLGLICGSLSGVQATAQALQRPTTPSILYPIAATALTTFGITPNNRFPTRFRTSEATQWFVLFIGCAIFIWYLRKLSNQIGELQEQNTGKILLLNTENEQLKKELADLRPFVQRPQIQSNPLPTSILPHHSIPGMSPLPHSTTAVQHLDYVASSSPIDEHTDQ